MSIAFFDGFDTVDTPLYRWGQTSDTLVITMLPAASTRQNQGQAVRIKHSGAGFGLSRSVPASATLYIGFAARFFGISGGTNSPGVELRGDGAATAHTTIRFDAGSGTLVAVRGSVVTGTILGSAPAGVSLNNWNYYEIRAVLSDTVGQIEVRVNGSATPVLNLSGLDTKNAGTLTTYDAVKLCVDGDATNTDYDDVVVLNPSGSAPFNTFLGDVAIKALLPTGPGASTQLASSSGSANWMNVDEAVGSLADYNSSSTDNQQDTYAMQDVSGTGTPLAVAVTMFAGKSEAGAKSVAPVLRIGGVDYVGTDQALSAQGAVISQLYETSPAGGAAWSLATVNAMECGARVRP